MAQMSQRMQDIGDVAWNGNASGANSTAVLRPIDMLRILINGATHPEIAKIWNKKTYTATVGSTSQVINTTVTNTSFEQEYYILGGKTGSWTNPVTYTLILISEPLTPAI